MTGASELGSISVNHHIHLTSYHSLARSHKVDSYANFADADPPNQKSIERLRCPGRRSSRSHIDCRSSTFPGHFKSPCLTLLIDDMQSVLSVTPSR